MSRFASLALALLGAITVVVRDAHAQRHPLSVDVNVGPAAYRSNGDFHSTNDIVAFGEAILAARLHQESKSGFTAAFNASVHTPFGGADYCRLRPDGSCAPRMADMRLYGVLAGWETGSGWLRAMTGVAYAAPGSGGHAIAVQARVDAAAFVVRRVGLVLSVRASFIPSYRGDRFLLAGPAVGLRLR